MSREDTTRRGGLHVALVCGRYDHLGGGAERWAHGHVRGLLGAGHRVSIIAERITGAPEGAELHPVTVSWRWPACRFAALARAASEVEGRVGADVTVDMGTGCGADVLMPHFGTREGNYRARMAMRGPVGRVLRAVDRALGWRHRRQARLERGAFASARVRRVVAVSEMVAGHMREYLGVGESRIVVVPNGVDVGRFRPRDEREREAARRSLGVEGRGVCLMVAHDFPLKNVPGAVRAMAAMGRRDAVLIVVGKDKGRSIVALARRLGCEAQLRMEGPRDDVLAYLHAADVLVHPTYYDPCSLVALEAAACGVPVVTTRQNGAAEVLGGAAIVLEQPGDAEALARAIDTALRPDVNRAMERAGLALRGVLDQARSLAACIGVYEEVHAERRAARNGRPHDTLARCELRGGGEEPEHGVERPAGAACP